jgi:hypothetical protein
LVHLANYKEKYGHCNVPGVCKEYSNIGNWAQNQRNYYKNFIENKPNTTHITKEQIHALEKLGFVWKLTPTFKERLEHLTKYKGKYGNCNVPQRFKECQNLRKWVTYRRYFKNVSNNKKNEEQIIELENLVSFARV